MQTPQASCSVTQGTPRLLSGWILLIRMETAPRNRGPGAEVREQHRVKLIRIILPLSVERAKLVVDSYTVMMLGMRH
jgi:hypothetical protein